MKKEKARLLIKSIWQSMRDAGLSTTSIMDCGFYFSFEFGDEYEAVDIHYYERG